MVLEGVMVARPLETAWALSRYRAGADLGDMMHIVASAKLAGFATFDRRIARHTDLSSPVPVQTLR